MNVKQKLLIKQIAKERILILLDLARKKVKEGEYDLARRYVELARKIALRANFRLKKLKRTFCKKCNIPLIFGLTARVRLNKYHKTINVTCLLCGNVKRYPYKPKKSPRRPDKFSTS
ncbi:MAG: ribonuclease P protein component 4 [Candidatus Aenigmatarchaeota archaeon]